MATGVETVGVALALLPLIVNQLDNYARGIEQIKLLGHYRHWLEDIALGLGTQHRIFLNNLEQVLDGVVDDDDRVRDLISDPVGEAWKEPSLQQGLIAKLGQDHIFFFSNVRGLHEILQRLAEKLDVDIKMVPQNTPPSKRSILQFRKILGKAVYEDLLGKIRTINDVLRTLMDQSAQLGSSRQKRNPWRRLLPSYKETRKNAEGLFRAIVNGPYWSCLCQASHGAHLRVHTNPLDETTRDDTKGRNCHIMFSDTWNNATNLTRAWKEVEFEAYEYTQSLTSAPNLAPPICQTKHQKPRKQSVQFDVNNAQHKATAQAPNCQSSSVPPIVDFCTVLFGSATKDLPRKHDPVGFVTHDSSSNIRFNMHFMELRPQPVQLETLHRVLPNRSRRQRLYIAARLACGVVRYHGNWLKEYWDISDIRIPVEDKDGADDIFATNLYLSWLINSQHAPSGTTHNRRQSPLVRNKVLFPLGIALTELSLGKSIQSLRIPQDEQENEDSTRFATAFRVLNKVQQESGCDYMDTVHSCLCWSGVEPPCLEDERFQERVLKTVVAPLLVDLAHFEGKGRIL